MPRPTSWLPRLHEIRRAVASSVRSHYDRHDIEKLFELQPRAAQKLMEMLPGFRVGASRLIDREVLSVFLDRVFSAEDIPALLEEIRREGAAVSRRKVRSLVRTDRQPVGLSALPESMRLERGRVEVTFRTVEDLAVAMLLLARILQDESDAFAAAYEPEPEQVAKADTEDTRQLFAELYEMERARG